MKPVRTISTMVGNMITLLTPSLSSLQMEKFVLNAPGTVHDSTMAIWGQVYERLLQMFEQYGVRCVVDSAFARENRPALIKSHQSNMDGNG
jgi:hypothetical protein